MAASFLPPEEGFLGLPAQENPPETARVILIPAPFEASSSYGRGSADGPRAIIEASAQVELFDAALGREPWRLAGGVATLAPLEVQGLSAPEMNARLEENVARALDEGRFVITLGGEHSSIVGAVQAHCRRFERLTVLQLDAHSDLRPSYQGDPWSHASAMARVLDFHDHLVQAGIRSQDKTEREISEAGGIPVFYGEAMVRAQARGEDWIGPIIDTCRQNVYLSLDCDVFDPSLIPATGTPEPGGLDWPMLDLLLERLCAARRLVGFDVSELMPINGLPASQFIIAKLISRLMARALARM